MHAQGYFDKIQQFYINFHKSLHFVKNEKNLLPSSPSTPPLSKPWKQTQKKHPLPPPPASSHLEANTPLGSQNRQKKSVLAHVLVYG